MDFDVHETDPGLDGVRDALEDDEHVFYLETDANGRIEQYTETGEGYGARIEQQGDSYEMLTVFTGDSEHAEQLNALQDSVTGFINRGIDVYNRAAGVLQRLPIEPEPETKDAVEAADLGLDLDFTEFDYIVQIRGADPHYPSKDYSQVEPHQLYQEIDDEFTTGCRTGNCGSMYLVQDGEIDAVGNGDYVPEDVRVFAE